MRFGFLKFTTEQMFVIIALSTINRKNNMDEYTYKEEVKLSADRDMFDKCCLSCCAEDAFYDIDLIPEEEEKENKWTF